MQQPHSHPHQEPMVRTRDLNDALMDAISEGDLQAVTQLLAQGADPNHAISADTYTGCSDYSAQPYSPLRLVVFRISDSFLDDAAVLKYRPIAAVLIQHGADATSAAALARSRYGEHVHGAPDSFSQVLQVVYDAIHTVP